MATSEKIQRRREIDYRKSRHEDECNIPLRFWHYTLESSPLAKTNPALIRALIEDTYGYEPSSWLLWGAVGVGKTGLAAAFGKKLLATGEPDIDSTSVVFQTVPELFTEIRGTYNGSGDSEWRILQRCSKPELLILDDLGAEKPSEWVRDRLFEIVNARHGDLTPLFVTSNLSPSQLADHVGERTMDRIVEMCGRNHIVHVEGPNLRTVRS